MLKENIDQNPQPTIQMTQQNPLKFLANPPFLRNQLHGENSFNPMIIFHYQYLKIPHIDMFAHPTYQKKKKNGSHLPEKNNGLEITSHKLIRYFPKLL